MTETDRDVPRLVVTSPADQQGLVLLLSRPQLVIGHSETADLVLQDRFVSRRHALVTVDPSGTVTIQDLNSTSGTFVNDERITGPRVLRAGDVVRFADLTARYEPGGPAAGMAEAVAETRVLPAYRAADPPQGTSIPEGTNAPAGTNDAKAPDGARGQQWPAEPGAPDGGAVAVPWPDGQPTYAVTGTVASPALPGIGGLAVQLLDKNVGGDQVLASTQTGSDGSYAFSHVVISPEYLADHHKTQPDLQVRVRAGDRILAASQVRYSAPTAMSLDVVLPAGSAGQPSEYETLTANLAAAYPGSLGGLQEGNGRGDITYLANKTGWDARAVALAALADQFSLAAGRRPGRHPAVTGDVHT